MGCEVRLAAEAEADRDAIASYLLGEAEAPRAARRFFDELDRLVESISLVPEAYPLSQDERLARMGYRKASFMSYVLLYRYDDRLGVAYVTNIFHQRQDYARLV